MDLFFEENAYYYTTDDRKINSAARKLSAPLQDRWLEHRKHITKPYSWHDFNDFLLRQLSNPVAQLREAEASRKCYSCCQKESQSVREFANFVRGLEMSLDEEFNDKRRIRYLEAKVLPGVFEESMKYQFAAPTDYSEFVSQLELVENCLEHRRKALSAKSRRKKMKSRGSSRRRSAGSRGSGRGSRRGRKLRHRKQQGTGCT